MNHWYQAVNLEIQEQRNLAQSLFHYMKLGEILYQKEQELLSQGLSQKGAERTATSQIVQAYQVSEYRTMTPNE